MYLNIGMMVRKIVFITIFIFACKNKAKTPISPIEIKYIDSIANRIDYNDSLDAYDWNGGIDNQDSIKDAVFAHAISMDTITGELKMARIGILNPEELHILYFQNGKLIKAKHNNSLSHKSFDTNYYYFNNGMLLNSLSGFNIDSIEKRYHNLADSSLQLAIIYKNRLHKKNMDARNPTTSH